MVSIELGPPNITMQIHNTLGCADKNIGFKIMPGSILSSTQVLPVFLKMLENYVNQVPYQFF